MALPTNRLILLFNDHRSKIAKVAILVAAAVVDPTGEAVAAIRAAIKALIRADSPKADIKRHEPVTDTVTDSALESIEDRAVLRFACAGNGNVVKFTIPSPGDIFLDDGVTVDPDNVGVAAFILFALDKMTDHTGSAITSYLGGSRYRTAVQKA